MQTQLQVLQQQLNDLRADYQQMQEKHNSTESLSASISHISHPVGRPSMMNGVKAMLQKLNGTQNQHILLPISVPSLVIGQQQGADTPPCSAHAASSSAAVFQYNPEGSCTSFRAFPMCPRALLSRKQAKAFLMVRWLVPQGKKKMNGILC